MKVVVCEHHPYDSILHVGSHAIAREFKRRGHQIVWLSHPRTPWLQRLRGEPLPPTSSCHDDGTIEVTLRAWAPYVDLPGLGTIMWGRNWLRTRSSKQRLAQENLSKCDLLWISDFTQLPLMDLVAARRVVFRVFDQIDRFQWMPSSIFDLIRLYRRRADLVIASSKGVQERLQLKGIQSVHIPNGADLTGFDLDDARNSHREDLAVYVGALESWFDLESLELWATGLPDIRFEIAGPNPLGLRSGLPNVRFLGPVLRDHVPSLLQRAKLGLIPFRLNQLTRSVHPLKLYDYLAAGCPVLSADLPEVREERSAIFKYTTPRQAIPLIARLMKLSVERGELYRLALSNSWAERLDRILETLGVAIQTREGGA